MKIRTVALIVGALFSLTACATSTSDNGALPTVVLKPNSPIQNSNHNMEGRSATALAERADVANFITKVSQKNNLDPNWMRDILNHTRIQPKIIDAMNRPAEGKKIWGEYRNIFMTERRINDGVQFYRTHIDALKRAEAQYGVDAEVIAAIIGVETSYGQNKGSWAVVDALATLAFEYPRRAEFFSGELEKFFVIANENRMAPFSLKGSYAGAMGYPQFMPSSYLAYAVDFDGDGVRDLWNNPVDAIGSVGNYLAKHNWRRGEPIAVRATVDRNNPAQIKYRHSGRINLPKASVNRLTAVGIEVNGPTHLAGELFEFQNSRAPEQYEYWVGYTNFYSITRYNHSQMYALAVFQLSQAIKERL